MKYFKYMTAFEIHTNRGESIGKAINQYREIYKAVSEQYKGRKGNITRNISS